MQNGEGGLTILIAEDDDGHAQLLRRGLLDAGLRNPLLRFKDGRETWDFLSGAAKPCFEPGMACLLLLDIRMPPPDGVELLRRMRADPRLNRLPVIMVTTTDDPKEIARCAELGSQGCLIKPVEFGQLLELTKRLGLALDIAEPGGRKV